MCEMHENEDGTYELRKCGWVRAVDRVAEEAESYLKGYDSER